MNTQAIASPAIVVRVGFGLAQPGRNTTESRSDCRRQYLRKLLLLPPKLVIYVFLNNEYTMKNKPLIRSCRNTAV